MSLKETKPLTTVVAASAIPRMSASFPIVSRGANSKLPREPIIYSKGFVHYCFYLTSNR